MQSVLPRLQYALAPWHSSVASGMRDTLELTQIVSRLPLLTGGGIEEAFSSCNSKTVYPPSTINRTDHQIA